MMSDPLLAFFRLLLLAIWTCLLLPPFLLAKGLRFDLGGFKRFYWQGVCHLAGISVTVHGKPAQGRSVLFASNHASYLDVPVLGACLPAVFAAKGDVAQWPVVGFLARLGDTQFVERKQSLARSFALALQNRLKRGSSVVFFPEATSSDGLRVLPFRKAGFEAALRQPGTLVQPVSVVCTQLNGMPIYRSWRPHFSWYGDMELGPHLWAFLGFGRTRVELVLHPPVLASGFAERSQLAAHCERASASGVARLLAGAGLVAANLDTQARWLVKQAV
jgi:1-acyl-sn-glycerol-3-phosphate acyltransferase